MNKVTEKLSAYTDKLDIKTAISISQVQIKRIKMKDGSIVDINPNDLKGVIVNVEKERPLSYREEDLLIK